MRVACPSCKTAYNIDDAKIPPTGANLKCAKCKATFPVKRDVAGVAPPAGTPAAPARPSASSPGAGEAKAPGRGPAIPLHGSGSSLPLPGSGGPSVPLPSGALDDLLPPPLPAAPAPFPAANPFAPAASMPGGDLDFLGSATAPPARPPAGSFGNVPEVLAPPSAPPLPRSLGREAPAAVAPPDPAVGFGEVDFGAGFDSAPAAPGISEEIDFNDPPPTAPSPEPSGTFGSEIGLAPPASLNQETDFSDVIASDPPPLASRASTVGNNGNNAESVEGDDIDFSGFESMAPAPSPAPTSAAPTPRRSESVDRDLMAPIEGAGGPSHLSRAAAGGPSTAAEDLELLDFIDEAGGGKEAGKTPHSGSVRYQVRRKSGKVFGPFEQAAIVKMLQEGQLLGNEDVTSDGDAWVPISSVQSFAAAIQQLMETPGGLAGLAPPGQEPGPGPTGPSSTEAALERMKALYGDRMAAIAVVDNVAAEEKIKKGLPLAIAAAVVVALLGFGFYLGTTPYGVFGLRRLFPSRLSKGSAAWTKYLEASNALQEDTFEGYRRAFEDAQSLLQQKESAIESRALFVQAVFYLKRQALAADEHLPRAKRYLEELELAANDDPDVVKARAGYHFINGEDAKIRPAIEAAAGKHKGDLELLFLLSESYRNTPPAADALKRVLALEAKNARALHRLGMLKTQEKNPDYKAAVELLKKALDANPRHLVSSVEIAAIDLDKLDDIKGATEALRGTLSEDAKKLLAPPDQARAHCLMGMLYVARHQKEEAVKEFEAALAAYPDSGPARAAYGRFLLRRNEHAKALELFEGAFKRNPKEIDYLDGLVRSMLGASKLGPAAKLVSDASADFPGSPRLAFLAGRVGDESDKGDEAERGYKRAAQGDSKLWEPSYYLGQYYLRRKRPDEAKTAFAEALSRAAKIPDTHAGQGDYLLSLEKVPEAKSEYLAALELDPESARGRFGLARVLASEGAFEDARKEYEAVLKVDATMPQVLTQYGALLWRLQDLPEAAKALEKAKSADPKDAGALWRLGAVYFEQSKLEDAMRSIESALSLDPYGPDAYFYKARVHYERHENNQAIEAIKGALERSSARPEFHYWRGNIYYQAGNFGDAVDSWEEAVKLKPDYADALEALGRGYQEQQGSQVTKAIGYYERAMKVDPSRSRLLLNVADCLSSQNRHEKAIAKYLEALKVDPTQVSAYAKIGRSYNERSKLDRAIEWWLKATEHDPEARDVWRYLGYAYKEKGKTTQAIKAFKKYLDIAKDAGDRKEIDLEINDLSKGG